MLKKTIRDLVEGRNLSREQTMSAMRCIMDGEATPTQIGSFLTALRIKGETAEEIGGCAMALREKAEAVKPELDYYIDTCGTGGDGTHTYNISTAAAIIAAAAGVKVAKHGNRAMSSRCGSADVLEALGVNIRLTAEQASKCMETVGIGFMFAQIFHPSMRNVADSRRELGFRTIFNILGPLANPARAKGQVLGVFDAELMEPVAGVLIQMGVEKALVVHGMDGMDEISTTGTTLITEVKDAEMRSFILVPEDAGLGRARLEELSGGDAKTNAGIIRAILDGEKGPRRDIALLNAAAAIYVGRKAGDIAEGLAMAAEAVDSKKADAIPRGTSDPR
jgi:anthranilate phosphoribosyltransferase